MKNKLKKKAKKPIELRKRLIKLAARIMYEENVSHYFDAKRTAARRLLKQGGGGSFRVIDLPSNGEIAEELAKMADLYEGDEKVDRLFAMRIIALDVMEKLTPFSPRLIGSVSTGRVRSGSDIDIHVFTDNFEQLIENINQLNWQFEIGEVAIKKQGVIEQFSHIYIHYHFPIELSVYPSQEIRVRGRSSTDLKPIVRMKPSALQELIYTEHSASWQRYLETGEIVGLPDTELESIFNNYSDE